MNGAFTASTPMAATLVGSATSWVDIVGNLAPGATVSYQVRGVGGSTAAPAYSPWVTLAATAPATPMAPGLSVAAPSGTKGSFTATITRSGSFAPVEYLLDWGTGSMVVTASTTSTQTRVTVSGLTSGTTYSVSATARNAAGSSPLSVVRKVTVR